LKLTAEEVAQGIRAGESKNEKITYSVIDPFAFAEDGGPSIAERMAAQSYRRDFVRADNKRACLNGAQWVAGISCDSD